jgi:hypothetical protein
VFGPLLRTLARRPILTTAVGLVAVAVFTAGVLQVVGWARWQAFAVRIDAASRPQGVSPAGESVASWSFAYRDHAVRLRVPVDRSELARARDVDTAAVFRARGALRSHYVTRVVRAQSQSRFIDGLAEELRVVRRERGLDDDEYLELLARAVQSLPYGTKGQRVRLPIDAVASGYGVCSERALVLGALMVHEGYDTAMWVLDSQNHVALGVASDAATFRESGYAFIETNRASFIGQVAEEYCAAGPVASPPQLIVLGGTRRYRSGHEVAYILSELRAAQETSAVLASYSYFFGSVATRFREENEDLPRRRAAARALVDYIRGQTDEREAVFKRLVASASMTAAGGPPALAR